MQRSTLISAVAIFSLTCGALRAGETGGQGTPVSSQAAFARIKGLAGEWRGALVGDTQMPGAVVRYHVTSAGSAVEETLAPGTPHEMVTLYHLDGDRLMLTHYCAAGNQPRMVLNRKKSTADTFVFEFAGGTNLKRTKDGHMHALRLRFTGHDTLAAEWDYWKEGKLAGVEKFALTRSR